MAVTESFLGYLTDLLAWLPKQRSRPMFGGYGLYGGELFFAIVVNDTLYLKGGANNRQLYRAGGAETFSYLRQGKPQGLDYWSVPADILEESELLRHWVRAALDAASTARN